MNRCIQPGCTAPTSVVCRDAKGWKRYCCINHQRELAVYVRAVNGWSEKPVASIRHAATIQMDGV